jgi:hypothetical protein
VGALEQDHTHEVGGSSPSVPTQASSCNPLQTNEATSTSGNGDGAAVLPPNCNEAQENADFCKLRQQGANKSDAPFSPDLSMIIERWADLPLHIRAAILALIGTAGQ